jgi:hypothetical protein
MSFNLQTPQQQARITNFFVVGTSILLPCTTTSGATPVAFPVPASSLVANDMMISNTGSVDAWIAFGDSSVAAVIPTAGTPANGINIRAGAIYTLSKGDATYIAGITASSTANLYVSQGYGS